MACYRPMYGFQGQDGKFTYRERGALGRLVVPCGGCVGCRLKRTGEWAVRGSHELQMSSLSSFITLTLDDKRLPFRLEGQIPANVGLYYPDFQDFMKRLRERFGEGVRYIVAGEYGDKLGRPHYHAILYNCHFADRKHWYRSKQGHNVFRSELLEELWPFGNCEIGSVTPESIAYVARYVMKKVTGKNAAEHYHWIEPSTGEIFLRKPEFAKYSLKPGIGYEWFMKHHDSVYPHDYVIFNGRKVRPPRYYDKLYERLTGFSVKRDSELFSDDEIFDVRVFSQAFDDIKATRIESAQKFLDDTSPERLYVREQVALAKTSRLKRKLT